LELVWSEWILVFENSHGIVQKRPLLFKSD